MEYWLIQDGQKLQLPVPPPTYEIEKSMNNTSEDVEGVGEISFLGKPKLKIISLESFFPLRKYSFCQYKTFPKPKDCVKLIEAWQESGKPIRLVITGTSINALFSIETFTYGAADGTGDIKFKLTLKEYKVISTPITVLSTSSTSASSAAVTASTTETTRPVEKTTPASYTVKSGDTLWAIAKREYGDGSKYTEIASKNGLSNPNLIQVGQVLLL